jgi:prevent-host-death family protein
MGMKSTFKKLDNTFIESHNSFMKIASITETKNQLSALLEKVKAGEIVVICDRDQPVARLCPISSFEEDLDESGWDARLRRLERKGLVRRPANGRRLPEEWLAKPLLRAKCGASGVEILLKQRDERP